VIFEKRIAKKVIDERIKSGQICPPLVLSVGKKGLVLEGLTVFFQKAQQRKMV